jgi:hypothetical protein
MTKLDAMCSQKPALRSNQNSSAVWGRTRRAPACSCSRRCAGAPARRQSAGPDRHLSARVAAQFAWPRRMGARVEARWQLQVVLQRCGAASAARGETAGSCGAVAQQVGHRLVGLPLQLAGHAQVATWRAGPGAPAVASSVRSRAVVGLQRDLVTHRGPAPAARRRPACAARGMPIAGAPFARPSRWTAPGRGNTARLAAAARRQSGCAWPRCRPAPGSAMVPTSMLADRPLRPAMASPGMPHSGASAGKQHEQHHHDGRAQQRPWSAGNAAASHQRRFADRHVALTSAVSRPISATSMARR